MNWTKESLRSFILSIVKPLKAGKSVSQSGAQATLDELYPDGGSSDNFRLTAPFGFISKIPVGVVNYYQNLFGSGHESIVLNQIHSQRPEPAGVGSVVVYSTDASGNSMKVTIALGSDGNLIITAPTKVTVICDNIELGGGGLEKVLNGETFQTFFNQHQHLGNLGSPTGVPINPSIPAHLSSVVKAKK